MAGLGLLQTAGLVSKGYQDASRTMDDDSFSARVHQSGIKALDADDSLRADTTSAKQAQLGLTTATNSRRLADLNRDTATTDAMRAAAQGLTQGAQQNNAARSAAIADPMAAISKSTGSMDTIDPPQQQQTPNLVQTYAAMRDAALASGDTEKAALLSQHIKQATDEGNVEVVKAALSGKNGKDLGDLYNSFGTRRVVPDSMQVDKNGILTAVDAATGQALPPIDLKKAAVMHGLIKPDEFVPTGTGTMGNKRTGEVKGEPILKPKDYTEVTHDAEGNPVVVDLRNGAAGGTGAAAGDRTVPSTKTQKVISDEVDALFKDAIGTPPEAKGAAKVAAMNIYQANKDPAKQMTPALSAAIGAQINTKPDSILMAKDPEGNVWRVTQYDGKTYNLDAKPVQSVRKGGGAAPAANGPPQAAIDYLKANPGAAAQFKTKYGVDPQQYLPKPAAAKPAAAAPAPAPAGSPVSRGLTKGGAVDYAAIPDPPPRSASLQAWNDWNEKWGDLYRDKQDQITKMVDSGYKADQAASASKYRLSSLAERAKAQK